MYSPIEISLSFVLLLSDLTTGSYIYIYIYIGLSITVFFNVYHQIFNTQAFTTHIEQVTNHKPKLSNRTSVMCHFITSKFFWGFIPQYNLFIKNQVMLIYFIHMKNETIISIIDNH